MTREGSVFAGIVAFCGVAGIAVTVSHCREKTKPEPAPVTSAPTASTPAATSSVATTGTACPPATSGLTAAEEQTFFHLSEGSENLPLFLLRKLGPGGTSFLEHPERFGLWPDPQNQKKLPIGMTAGRPKDVAPFKVDFVGFNCAACHVGRVSVGACTQQLLGAPSRFDIRAFYAELGGALRPLASAKGVLTVLKWWLEAIKAENPGNVTLAAQAFETQLELARVPDDAARDGSGDLVGAFQKIFESPDPPPTQKDPQLERLRLPAGLGPDPKLGEKLAPALPSLSVTLQEQRPARAQQALRETLEDYYNLVMLLRARLSFIGKVTGKGEGSAPQTVAGPGRVDAFMTAIDLIYGKPGKHLPITSPVSFPRIWGVADLKWFHWDNNTTSILDRNIGQAIGLGAVFTRHDSTLELRNIDRLEALAERLKRPAWPFALDPGRRDRGRQAYERVGCDGCHTTNGVMENPPDLDTIGTDKLRVTNLQQPVNGKAAIETLGNELIAIKKQAYIKNQIGKPEQEEMERHRTVEFIAAKTYSARSLAGIWATAPYLHNNSVPTLAHLLGLKERPQAFTWTGGDYDTENVGLPYKEDPAGAFKTSDDGNANTGHTLYFKALRDDAEKWDLIEFLKSL